MDSRCRLCFSVLTPFTSSGQCLIIKIIIVINNITKESGDVKGFSLKTKGIFIIL